MRRLHIFATALVIGGGCDSHPQEIVTSGVVETCQKSLGWRTPSEGTIACPSTAGCSCAGSSICCAATAGGQVSSASCMELNACKELAIACDGPEDCGGGEVCCATSPTSMTAECHPANECASAVSLVFCRKDADCAFPFTRCVPATKGAFFEGMIAHCK
jgi:hypothetical protein